MRKKIIAGVLMSGMLAISINAASADPYRGGGDPGRSGGFRNDGGRYDRQDSFDRNHVWRKGERYTGPRNNGGIINDWRGRQGLWQPPRGYYWMQYGNQYLLTAIATGLIAGVVGGAVANPPPPSPGYQPPPPPPGPY